MAFVDSGIEPVRRPKHDAVIWETREREAARAGFDAAFVREAIRELKPLYARLERVIPPFEWAGHAPYIKAIRDLKRERNAVILAHNYMTPRFSTAWAISGATACNSPRRRRKRTRM